MKNYQNVLASLVMTFAMAFPVVGSAGIIDWDISGPGTLSSSGSLGDETLSYNYSAFSGTWTVFGVADQAGDYTFDYDYSGLHSWYQVTAFLTSSAGDTLYSAGPQNCCTTPSNGFSTSGIYTFTNVGAGDTIGFSLGGSNYDSAQILQGSLHLAQVPEPAALALFGLGLLGVAFSKRRKMQA